MKEDIQLGQNRIILVGTGHVFQESVDLARKTITEVHPDYVALELDPERLIALESESREKPGILDMMRMGIRIAILGAVLSYFQGKVGEETGVLPGSEMLEATKAAEDMGARVELIDRSVSITLNRLVSAMSMLDMLRIVFYMLLPSKVEVENLDEDLVDDLTEELYKLSPSAYRVLIEERDCIMAENISKLSGTIVVVVGAGHVKGIKKELIERYKNGEEEES
ncbi:MAG: TraB/GumN family protein [Theionarchaea archaeon]|nr:TraB/GumN family protein [Theionarchaea archaeon]